MLNITQFNLKLKFYFYFFLMKNRQVICMDVRKRGVINISYTCGLTLRELKFKPTPSHTCAQTWGFKHVYSQGHAHMTNTNRPSLGRDGDSTLPPHMCAWPLSPFALPKLVHTSAFFSGLVSHLGKKKIAQNMGLQAHI